MTKLKLIIADTEESYVRRLTDYINSKHSQTFAVSSFTKAESFIRYMGQQLPVDIVMISPDFYDLATEYKNIKLKLLLSGGALSREFQEFQKVNKYSTGESLVNEIIHLYSLLNMYEHSIPSDNKSTDLIGVYSPAGGTGKTTVASSLAIQCTERGLPSLYLNFESFQSTGLFFGTDGNRNLSYIFYYLKEKSNNLSLRLSGIKSTDAHYGVQYFNPPENPMEYEEINTLELEQLLKRIREMGCCDYVFLDMSSTFDMKNYRILELCDRILLVTLPEPVSTYKNRLFYKEIAKLSGDDKECLSDKVITIINRDSTIGCSGDEAADLAENSEIRLPEYSGSYFNENGRLVINDEAFMKAVNRVIEVLI